MSDGKREGRKGKGECIKVKKKNGEICGEESGEPNLVVVGLE